MKDIKFYNGSKTYVPYYADGDYDTLEITYGRVMIDDVERYWIISLEGYWNGSIIDHMPTPEELKIYPYRGIENGYIDSIGDGYYNDFRRDYDQQNPKMKALMDLYGVRDTFALARAI